MTEPSTGLDVKIMAAGVAIALALLVFLVMFIKERITPAKSMHPRSALRKSPQSSEFDDV